VLTPSERHVSQTTARWRASGFDAHVVPLSPYEETDPAAVRRAAAALRAGRTGLVVMDCMGFGRKTREEIASLTGVPTLLANLLVARVAAELISEGGSAPLPNLPPEAGCAGKAGARTA
jgi:protein AroM